MPSPVLKLGQITIFSLSDGGFAAPPANFLPAVPAEAWQEPEAKQYLDEQGNVPLNFGSFLIQEGNSWSLVDTGVGGRGGFAPPGRLLGELEKAKVTPEQIGRVIITHLHLDHIGWNTIDKDGKPEVLFKNARHIVQRKDWEHWTQPAVAKENPVIGLCAEPVMGAGLMDLIDGDAKITDGISALFTPGHTPGHQSLLVASGDEQAVITGDATHTKAQLEHPDWSPGFDSDPAQAAQTRAALFARIENEGLKVCAGHYPWPGLGTLVRVEGKRRWQGL